MLTKTNHINDQVKMHPFPARECGEEILESLGEPSPLGPQTDFPGLPRRPAFRMTSAQGDPGADKSSSGSRSSLLSDARGESLSTVVTSSITESSVSVNSQGPDQETMLSSSTIDLTEEDPVERPHITPAHRRLAHLRIDALSAEDDVGAVRLPTAAARQATDMRTSLPSDDFAQPPVQPSAIMSVWPHIPPSESTSSPSVGNKHKRKNSMDEVLHVAPVSEEAPPKKANKPKPIRGSTSTTTAAVGGSSDGSGVSGYDHLAAGDDDDLQAVHGPWADIYAKVKLFVCMTPRNLANSDVMIRYANEDFFTNFGFDKASTLPLPLKALFGHGSSRLVLHKLHMALLTGKQAFEFINLYRADKRPLACHLVLVSITGNRFKTPENSRSVAHSAVGPNPMTGFAASSPSSASSVSTSSRLMPPEIAAQYEEKYAILTIRSASVIGNAKSYGIGFFGPGRIVSIQKPLKPSAPAIASASSASFMVDGEASAASEARGPTGVQRIRHSTISGRGGNTMATDPEGASSMLQYHHQAHGNGPYGVPLRGHEGSSRGGGSSSSSSGSSGRGGGDTTHRPGVVRRVSATSAELVGAVSGVEEFVQSSLSDRLARSTLSMQEAAMVRVSRETAPSVLSSRLSRYPGGSPASLAQAGVSLDQGALSGAGTSGDHKRRKLSSSSSSSSSMAYDASALR